MNHLTLSLTMTLAALPAGLVHAGEPATRLPRLTLHYESAFAGVATQADPPRIAWADSLALVGALQGHAGHWRQPPSAPPTGAPATPPPREGARP